MSAGRKTPLKLGEHVRLRRNVVAKGAKTVGAVLCAVGSRRQVTIIEGLFTDVEGGVVLKDRLEGFYCWNMADLERVPARQRK